MEFEDVALEYSLIKLILITLINEQTERACFEKRLIKTCSEHIQLKHSFIKKIVHFL
jgi:hypothetical protein